MSDNNPPQILLNRIKTPSGVLLTSRHLHDYVSYIEPDGTMFAVDGGFDYLKRIGEGYTEMSINSEDDWEIIRENFERGVSLPDGSIKYKTLNTLSNTHLYNILEYIKTQEFGVNRFTWVYEKEIKYRNSNNIKIDDETKKISKVDIYDL